MFESQVFDTIFIFVLGILLGSFANVIIFRIPKHKSIVTPRSHCQSCGKTVLWYDNIPIFSWILLKGQCRFCKSKFSIRYPLVEFLMGVMFAIVFLKVGWSWTLLEYLIFVFFGISSSFIDLDHFILPDIFTVGGIIIGLIGAFINPEREFLSAVYGILVGGGFLLLVAYGYFWLRGEEGMGGGDIKLLGWIGAVFGWQSIPFVVMVSSLLGSIVGIIVMIKSKKGLKTQIPFGPYLVLAAILYIFFGPDFGLSIFKFIL
jgi:leader peptidase (prepilin peptidase)/N-methyltransferase